MPEIRVAVLNERLSLAVLSSFEPRAGFLFILRLLCSILQGNLIADRPATSDLRDKRPIASSDYTFLNPLLSVKRDSIASRMSQSSAQPHYIAAHLSAQLQYRAATSEKQAYEAYLVLANENGWVGIASRCTGTRIQALV